MVPSGTGTGPGTCAKSLSTPSGTRQNMVSSAPIHASRLPLLDTARPPGERTSCNSDNRYPTIHMEYLRVKYRRKNYSQNSCFIPGEAKQISLMTHSLGSGIAGVLNGKQIPFQVL